MPPPRLFDLTDDLLRHVSSFLNEFEKARLAALCKAGRTLVQAHRCGVILPLRSRRPSQRDFLSAFGLSLSEIAPLYTAPKVGGATIYDLTTCLPLVLHIKGGWRGIQAAQDTQMQMAVKKQAAADAAAAERAVRRARVSAALKRADAAPSIDEFERRMASCRRAMPASLEAYLSEKGSFDDAFFDLMREAQAVQREREAEALLAVLPWPSPPARERACTYVHSGAGKTLVEALGDSLDFHAVSPWEEARTTGVH